MQQHQIDNDFAIASFLMYALYRTTGVFPLYLFFY